jgi:predicted MPP superfamily phosphohydrolase
MKITGVVAALAVPIAHGLKIGVIADLHFDPFYDPTTSADTWCENNLESIPDVSAPIGRHGCDPNFALIEVMLKHFRHTFASPDVLLIVGDHVGHGTYLYADKMKTIETMSELINNYFGDTPVLFQIGNNDTIDHDQAPSSIDREDYYRALWTHWFEKMDGNSKLKNNFSIQQTFIYGGFYRYDISSTVSVLVLNSMYYMIDNDMVPEGSVP